MYYKELNKINISHALVSMSSFTTFKTGGKALAAFPETLEQLKNLVTELITQKLPFFIMGSGSNILIPDEGMEILIIHTKNLTRMECENDRVIAECGAPLKDVCEFAKNQSLTGLEFASGIPGSVGGAVYMNAGAYDGEISQVLEYSDVLFPHLQKIERLSLDQHKFSYRYSYLMKEKAIVLSTCFRLKQKDSTEIQSKMNELTQKREEKQPLEYASAGSTFKRPEGYFAGKLISDAGLQGVNINGAEVSLKHAGFIVNKGNAKTKDIIELMEHVRNKVFEKYKVILQPEVCILNKDGSIMSLKEPV
ncbi:MAG: UDP-N-acetylmuramate dehydrogenase [Brevinema sp.]